jgi:preprotein translocase subunit SecE
MTQPTVAKKKGFRLFSYFAEIINELKKVVWLTRRELVYLTGLVLIVTIIAGIVLGALDFGFSELVSRVFLGR